MARDNAQFVPIFELNSNDGWDRLIFYGPSDVLEREKGWFLGKIVLQGRYWDRSDCLGGNIDTADLRDDFDVQLLQVAVLFEGLERLQGVLEDTAILGTQIDVLVPGECHEFSVLVATVEDETILADGKPVVRCIFRTLHLKGDMTFVSDQSCLRLAAVSLRAWLEGNV